ncbi:hypothetical protein SDRG_14925 [Saprolegnia diclina VS20]|uniref:non-specific serine/threonine protein kinase n=1 Tax=Saprolegnia diclina (strain VS20) TaxID=1156394 RepID=T0PPD2_SAPDV|nr:hypothetical protein SDRG_14925 [Saprolegnia diclina VS20]EQC27304.1 hypothetical protein SDRG_14925 [Saprolegnia diclina VS20]|eukprot:XP_008619307.1 hypothetical protein SDRG_14925 [Saprolegnia diclina VS20]
MEVWAEVRRQCRALRVAKKKTDKKREMIALDSLLTSSAHQAVLHRSGCWGYVIGQIFNVVEEDLLELTKKTKRKSASSTMELPNVNVLFHALDSARGALHENALGVDTLKRLGVFGELGINDEITVGTPVERHCYTLLEKLLSVPAYTQRLDPNLLNDVLGRVLTHLHLGTSIEHHNHCASIALHIIKGIAMDLHPHLPKYMDFFNAWFGHGHQVSTSVALNLLASLVFLMETYPTAMAPLVTDTTALAFVQRMLPHHLKALPLEVSGFLLQYYRLVPSSDVKHLCMALLDQTTMHTVFTAAFSVARQSAMTSAASTLDGSLLGDRAIAWYSMTADVVWLHDFSTSAATVANKRRRTTTALELVLERIGDTASASQGSGGTTAPTMYSQLRATASVESDVRRLPWLFLLLALISRHGHWLQAHRQEILTSVVDALVTTLDVATMDGYCKDVTCQLLVLLVVRSDDAASWATDVFTKIAADAGRRKPKESMLQLLAVCAAGPVPPAAVEAQAPALLTVVHSHVLTVSALTLAVALWTTVDTGVASASMRSFVLQGLRGLAPAANDESIVLLLLSGALAAVCDGMLRWDVATYLVPTLSSQFATCGLGYTAPKALDMRNHAHILPHLVEAYAGMLPVMPAPAAPRRLKLPVFVDEDVLRLPEAFVAQRRLSIVLQPHRSLCVDKDHLSSLRSDVHALLHEHLSLLPSASTEDIAPLLHRLLELGLVVAAALGLYAGLQQHIEAASMLGQVLSATTSRLTHLLKHEQYHEALFQKLYCLLLVLQGANLSQLTAANIDVPAITKVKIPPSCRVAARDLVAMLEAFVLSEAASSIRSDLEDPSDDMINDDDVSRFQADAASASDAACRLWSLRIVLLLKKSESSCHLVHTVVQQNYVAATSAVFLVPLLCFPLTSEGVRVGVSLIKSTAKIAPEDATHMLRVLSYHVTESLPPELLQDVVALLEYLGKKFKHNRIVRRRLLQCWEAWYLVNVDTFGGFIEVNLPHLVDKDVHVRVASLVALRTLYTKFEGVQAIYNDVFAHLQEHEADTTTFILACYVAACVCPSLLPLVLSQYVENGQDDALVVKSILALSDHHGYASPMAMCEDQLWGILASYLGLLPRLQCPAESSDTPWMQLGLRLFDANVPSLAAAIVAAPSLRQHLLPFLVLLDVANSTADHVGALLEIIPDLRVPDEMAVGAKVVAQLLLDIPVTTAVDVTPSLFRCVCEMTFALVRACPELAPRVSWAVLAHQLPHSFCAVDIALCLSSIVGTTHAPTSRRVPLQCLCDCLDALGYSVANNVLAQRLLLSVLLRYMEESPAVSVVLKATVERCLQSDPDVLGANLNFLVQSVVPMYTRWEPSTKSLLDGCLVAVAQHPKLHKHIVTLDPIPLHVSPSLDQLAATCNASSQLDESLVAKLQRTPLDAVPFSSFGLQTLDGIMPAMAKEKPSTIAAVVYGLLHQAYQRAPASTPLVPTTNDTEALPMWSQPSQPTLLKRASSSSYVAPSGEAPPVLLQLATCLGHLGAVFPSAALHLDASALNALYLHVYHRPCLAQLQAYKDSVLEVRAKVLEYVVCQLFANEMRIISTATTTLRTLLGLPVVHTTLLSTRSLSSSLKVFLSLVEPTSSPGLPTQIASRAWPAVGETSVDTWAAQCSLHLISLCEDPLLHACVDLVSVQPTFGVCLLPLALHAVVMDGRALASVSGDLAALLATDDVPPGHGQLLVHSLQYASQLEKSSARSHAAKLLHLPWLDVARLALASELPYSALQFVEKHVDAKHRRLYAAMDDDLVPILRAIYDAIGDLDGMDGVLDTPDLVAMPSSYAMERKISSSLPLYDAALRLDPHSATLQAGLATSLETLGYAHLLQSVLSATKAPSPYTYELAWKSMQWDLKVDTSSFEGCVYGCLRGLAVHDHANVELLLGQAKTSLLQSQQVAFTGLESTKRLQTSLLQLETLGKLEAVLSIQRQSAQDQLLGAMQLQTTQHELLGSWTQRHSVYEDDADALLRALELESTLLSLLEWPTPTWHLKRAKAARKADRPATAFAALAHLEAIKVTSAMQSSLLLEKARTFYATGDAPRALLIAKHVHKALVAAPSSEPLLLAQTQLTIGKWLASMRAERNEVIHTQYLSAATALFERLGPETRHGKEASKAYLVVANYLYDNYLQVKTRVESSEWKRGKQVALAQEQELHACEKLPDAERSRYMKHIVPLRKQVEYDKKERAMVENSVLMFLTGALHNYGLCLRYAPVADMTPVFRIVSLWFEHGAVAAVTDEMATIVETVPSYKLLPLSYQILSRLASSVALPAFHSVLEALALKMGVDHPHHTLVQLLALKNTGKQGSVQFRDNVGSSKAEAAARILAQVQKHSSTSAELVQNMEVLCDAYVKLALYDTTEFARKGVKKIPCANVVVGPHNVAFDQCLRLRRLNQDTQARPAVLTLSIAPRSDRDYTHVPRVQSFETTFTITDTGIHRPKILFCFGSDGLRRKQLVKGNDDTRQDLVIEQTFEMVNTFLAEQSATKQRQLHIKTYKVTPLGPIAGVLEWVENTLPIGNYLTSRGMDAHGRYHPSEWKHPNCRQHLMRATDKYQAFLEIQAHFTPVFHHFFLEKFPDPANWYAKRVAYTRSVAVTSIVGHILGIGDRHSSNILIDEATGDLVHIDFGVVFDQGMALQTPETVPFRLTRDLVDGMGVTGVDGLFTRTCEETLKVLRKKGAALTTILEVFIHDPLYNWTLSPVKALKMQQESQLLLHKKSDVMPEENVADAASRALLRVKQKLQGYEDPTGDAMSVEGQVKRLVHMAQDPHNLCKLYPGWGPWL